MRALNNFDAYALSSKSPDEKQVVPESFGPSQQINRDFLYQSYFDSTLLERALLPQRQNDPIVDPDEVQTGGYALVSAPWSQAPAAVQFKVGGQTSSSAPLILKPGHLIRPFGLPKNVKSGAFSGFRWGLPFGWLGGGTISLYVLQTPDADNMFWGDPEIIFHRARYQIVAPGSLPTAAPNNWPMRFPWKFALQGTESVPQNGQASVTIGRPTRILMRLRLASLGAAADMRMLWQGTNDFDVDQAGDGITTPVIAQDVTWGSWTGSGGAGDLATAHQIMERTDGPAMRVANDIFGGLQLVDLSGGSLAGQYVDIVRYGRI